MQRLDGPIDVDYINRTFFPKDLNDLESINSGRCFLWAYIAYRLYKDAQLYDMGSHAFVYSKSTKRYYDSEVPQGVKRWRKLRATYNGQGCGCSSCTSGKHSQKILGKFRDRWRGSAEYHKVDWKALNFKIKAVLWAKQHVPQSLAA
jgi:hypothetical protein